MFATVRRYRGLEPSVIEAVAANAIALRTALASTPGSRGCHVISTREGLIVVATADDEVSVIESGRRFVAWADRYLPALRDAVLDVWAGAVLVHDTADDTRIEEEPIHATI